MKWMAPPKTPAELAERDRVLKGRISIGEATVSINVGFGPDIPIFQPRISRSTEMTAQEKIEFIKKNLAAPRTEANTKRVSHLNGKFDPRPTFTNASVHALFPDAGRDDFPDDRSNAADDDDIGSTSLGVAHDLLACRIAGEEGTSACVHEGGDHVDMARQVLERYAKDETARKQNLASVGQQHSVRFA